MPKETFLITREDVRKDILAAVGNGLSIKSACDYAGINESTFYVWQNKCQEDLDKGKKDSVYVDFFKSLKKARIAFKHANLKNIQNAAKKHWQASAWILERTFPEEYGSKQIVNNNDEINKVEKLLEKIEVVAND